MSAEAGWDPDTPDPSEVVLKRCRKALDLHEQGLITADELHGALADVLVHAGVRDEDAAGAGCWDGCLDALPATVAMGLLAYLRGTTRPHGFFLTSGAKAYAALGVQARLVSALEARLR
jgi:hypothetical protein